MNRQLLLGPEDIERHGFAAPNPQDTDGDDTDVGEFRQNEKTSSERGAQLAGGSVAITLIGIITLLLGTIVFIFAYMPGLTISGGGLVVSTVGNHAWRKAVSKFDQPVYVNEFVTHVNYYEFGHNLFVTLVNMAIITFNFCLGLLYLLFYFFWNLAVFIFRSAFAVLGPYLEPMFTAFTRVAVMIMKGFESTFGQLNADNPQNFGASQEETIQNDIDDESSRFFQVVNFFMNVMNSMEDIHFHEWFNFIADPVVKEIANIFKFVADAAALLGKAGTWSKWFGTTMKKMDILDLNAINGCQLEKWGNKANCWFSKAYRDTVCGLFDFLHIKCPIDKTDCDPNDGGSCAKKDTSVEASEQQSQIDAFFGIGVCDEVECEYFVEDLFTVFNKTIPSCSFWTVNPNVIFDCLRMTTNFSNINNTSPSRANPAIMAIEMCFVAYAYNLKSCQDYGLPFIFSFSEAANDICNNTRYGASFTECACTQAAPLCDAGCCHKYADHVNMQVLGQIGSYTCASLSTTFSSNKVWCPLVSPQIVSTYAGNGSRSLFPDNTYASMWCAYFENVLYPACQEVAGFTLISDLQNIDSVMADFRYGECNLTVDQVGVCIPINASITDLATSIVSQSFSTYELFDLIGQQSAPFGVEIPTVFTDSDDAATVFQKTLNMHFCEQYSETVKNGNMIIASQPWNIESIVSGFCDSDVLAAHNDLAQLTVTAIYKYRQPNGNAVPKTLPGVPDAWGAFGDSVNPNTETEACTADVGVNEKEKADLDQCVETVKSEGYALTAQMTEENDATMQVLYEQDNYTSQFYSSSGIVELDPSSPNYAEQQQQLDRTNNALNADVDFVDPPYQDLPNVTQEFRYNWTTPPDDASPDSNNPGAPFLFGPKQHDTNYIGRVILSAETNKPIAPNYFQSARMLWKKYDLPVFPSISDYLAMPAEIKPEMDIVEKLLVHAFGPPTKHDRAVWGKMKRRIERASKVIEHEMHTKFRVQYESQGYSIDDVDHFPHTRKLLMTGDPVIDTRINEFLSTLSYTPHTPIGTSPENFNVFLENDLKSMGLYIYRSTLTKALPAFLLNLLTTYNRYSPFNFVPMPNVINVSAQLFGAQQHDPNCLATMSDPYRCCTATSTSYQCCKGLIGCIPEVPEWMWITPTTSETIDRWYCTAVNSFWSWWKWLIKLILSAIVSIIKYVASNIGIANVPFENLILSQSEIPDNMYSCMLATSKYFWWGVFIAFAVYLFISVQIFTLFSAYFSNFRQQQSIQDDVVANLQAQIKRSSEQRGDVLYRRVNTINQ